MRFRAVLLAVLIVLSGCSGLLGGDTGAPTSTPAAPAETETVTASNTTEMTQSKTTNDVDAPVIGRENGIWYNTTLSINADNGLNETEREKVISRTMARVEYVRDKEFKRSVSISLRSREEYKQRANKGNYSKSFRRFDNAKFEAMFLIGEKNDSLAVQQESRSQSVLGFYSAKNDSIVIVTNSETPSLNGEATLAHELTHALQDQYFNISNYTRATRDGHNAVNGLIEGGASLVQQRYMSHCGEEWECLPSSQRTTSSGPTDWGVYFLNYFPYADGPQFVEYYQRQGGWDRVDELFENPPVSAEQIIYPKKYNTDRPTNVTLTDRTRNGWKRVRPESPRTGTPRLDYASLGQSGLTAMFAATIGSYDNKPGGVIPPRAFLNLESGASMNRSNPLEYGLQSTNGWDGDRMHVYHKNDELAYVWKIAWDSKKDASQFATTYRSLIEYWGGTKVGTNTWDIKSGPYADAFSVAVKGDTVVIVNAPRVSDLNDVRQGS